MYKIIYIVAGFFQNLATNLDLIMQVSILFLIFWKRSRISDNILSKLSITHWNSKIAEKYIYMAKN